MDIVISKNEEYMKSIIDGINDFNYSKYPDIFAYTKEDNEDYIPFGFYALVDDKVVGGMYVYKQMQWLKINVLFVKEAYRNKDIGSKLMKQAEEYCKKEHLIGMHLTTLDFQAKGFYEKQNFELIAQIKDWPKGITRYEFIKYII